MSIFCCFHFNFDLDDHVLYSSRKFYPWTRRCCVKPFKFFRPQNRTMRVSTIMERQQRLSRTLIVGRTCGSRRRRFLVFVFLASVLLSFATSVAAEDIVNRTTDIETNNNGRKRSLVINSDKLEDDVIVATNLDEEETSVRHKQQNRMGCNSCKKRAEVRSLSLAHIKEHVLNKLGLKEPPNLSGRLLPKLPPGFLDSYKLGVTGSGSSSSEEDDQYGMQNDQPSSYEQTMRFQPGPKVVQEPDNYHARTDRVIAFAQPR